jgi:uracil-DNA glycosylase
MDNVMHPSWARGDGTRGGPDSTNGGTCSGCEVAAGTGTCPPGRSAPCLHLPAGGGEVLIVGQDPYPTPGHPMGLSFSVQPHVPPDPPLAGEHLPGVARRSRHRPRPPRGPDPLEREGRHAAEPGPERASGRVRLAPRSRLGAGDRPRHRHSGGPECPLVAILWGRDPRPSARRSGRRRSSHPPTLPALGPRGVSSAPAPSPAPTPCWPSRARARGWNLRRDG